MYGPSFDSTWINHLIYKIIIVIILQKYLRQSFSSVPHAPSYSTKQSITIITIFNFTFTINHAIYKLHYLIQKGNYKILSRTPPAKWPWTNTPHADMLMGVSPTQLWTQFNLNVRMFFYQFSQSCINFVKHKRNLN